MNLMDGVLKKVNLDLEILTYGILVTGKNDGIMEFVSPSMPVSAVIAKHKGYIQNYLRENYPDKGECPDTAFESNEKISSILLQQ